MKFEDLYNKIYITEQEADAKDESQTDKDASSTSGVPMPEEFDDVEPAPVPTNELPSTEGVENAEDSAVTGATLKDYIIKLTELSNELQSIEGDCLQSLVSKLDKPNTPFDGISRTNSDIIRTAETLSDLAINLTSFIINAAK